MFPSLNIQNIFYLWNKQSEDRQHLCVYYLQTCTWFFHLVNLCPIFYQFAMNEEAELTNSWHVTERNLHRTASVGFKHRCREQRGQYQGISPGLTASIRLYKIPIFQSWWTTTSPCTPAQFPIFSESMIWKLTLKTGQDIWVYVLGFGLLEFFGFVFAFFLTDMF